MARPTRRSSVPTPRSMAVERRGELKKHVGAVHVKGSLSLLERKVSNVLLLNAYEELPMADVLEHEIRLKTLAELSGFDSNDHALLRESLESLARTTITWNLLDAEGQEEWGVSTFLAQAVTRGGVCRYAYAPDLRKKLYNPEIYARINLSVQEQFGSGYALALYENCVRFRRVGSTGWIGIEQWRDMLGVEPGQYESFKYLNRDVLKPAVGEVNAYSDIRVTMERRLEKRRVVALRFAVGENVQLVLELDGGVARAAAGEAGLLVPDRPDPRSLAPEPAEVIAGHPLADLQRRLLSFGLTEAQALDLSTEFPAARVTGNLDHVQSEIARGQQPKNAAAYTVAAIRGDYAAAAGTPPVVEEVQQQRETARVAATQATANAERTAATKAAAERAAADARRQSLDVAWTALSPDEQAAITERAVALMKAEAPQVHRWYRTELDAGTAEDEMRPSVRTTLRDYRNGFLAI